MNIQELMSDFETLFYRTVNYRTSLLEERKPRAYSDCFLSVAESKKEPYVNEIPRFYSENYVFEVFFEGLLSMTSSEREMIKHLFFFK